MKEVSTKNLLEELVKRDGTEEIIINPYEKFEIKVKDQPIQTEVKDGPVRIIIVWD